MRKIIEIIFLLIIISVLNNKFHFINFDEFIKNFHFPSNYLSNSNKIPQNKIIEIIKENKNLSEKETKRIVKEKVIKFFNLHKENINRFIDEIFSLKSEVLYLRSFINEKYKKEFNRYIDKLANDYLISEKDLTALNQKIFIILESSSKKMEYDIAKKISSVNNGNSNINLSHEKLIKNINMDFSKIIPNELIQQDILKFLFCIFASDIMIRGVTKTAIKLGIKIPFQFSAIESFGITIGLYYLIDKGIDKVWDIKRELHQIIETKLMEIQNQTIASTNTFVEKFFNDLEEKIVEAYVHPNKQNKDNLNRSKSKIKLPTTGGIFI